MGRRSKNTGNEALARARAEAVQALEGGRNAAIRRLDDGEQRSLDTIAFLQPNARTITGNAFDTLANFEDNATKRSRTAQEAFLQPSQRRVSEQLQALFSRFGVGGVNNSKVQNTINRFGEEVAFNEGVRQFELDNAVRDRILSEQNQLFNIGSQPINARRGTIENFANARSNAFLNTASQIGNTVLGSGQAIAQNQQQNARRRDRQKGGVGSAIGGVVGLGATALGR